MNELYHFSFLSPAAAINKIYSAPYRLLKLFNYHLNSFDYFYNLQNKFIHPSLFILNNIINSLKPQLGHTLSQQTLQQALDKLTAFLKDPLTYLPNYKKTQITLSEKIHFEIFINIHYEFLYQHLLENRKDNEILHKNLLMTLKRLKKLKEFSDLYFPVSEASISENESLGWSLVDQFEDPSSLALIESKLAYLKVITKFIVDLIGKQKINDYWNLYNSNLIKFNNNYLKK